MTGQRAIRIGLRCACEDLRGERTHIYIAYILYCVSMCVYVFGSTYLLGYDV